MSKAIYAASFDPPTNGHLWIIEQGSLLFEKLIIAVGTNPQKTGKYSFSLDERLSMLKEISNNYKNVEVVYCGKKFTVDFAKSFDAQYLLRGIRNDSDYESEKAMRYINGDLDSKIIPVFLMPPRELAEISSSMVKGLIGYDNWKEAVKKYVPQEVYKMILEKNAKS